MADEVLNQEPVTADDAKSRPNWGRIALFAGLVAIFAFVAYSRQKEALEVWNTLRAGNPVLIAGAMAIQVVYWFSFAAMYQTSYKVVGLHSRVRDLLPVWLGSLFVSIAAPAAAPAVFLDEAVRRGQSPAKATAGMLVLRLTDFGTLCVIIACGIAAMATRLAVHPWQSKILLGHCIALLILVGVTLAWSGPLFLARWRPKALLTILTWVRDTVNRLFRALNRPEPLVVKGNTDRIVDNDWAMHHAANFTQSADLALANPVRLLAPASVALMAHFLDWASLHVMLSAYGIVVDPGISLIAFSVCLLYWIVSPTPDGVGFVETAVALTLVTVGVAQKHEAIAAAIAFRGITLYLPILLGGLCLPRLAAATRKPAVSEAISPAQT